MKYTRVNYLSDYIVVQSFSNLTKRAEDGFFENFKDEIIKAAPKDAKSLGNFLAPAFIYQIITSLTGSKWVGTIIGILISVFKIDVMSILGKICEEIKQLVSSGVGLTEDKIASIVDSHMPATTKTSELIYNKIALSYSYSKEESNALAEFANRLSKSYTHSGIFNKLISLLWTFLRFFFVTSLTAGGLLVGGAAFKALFLKSNPENSSEEKPVDLPTTKQNKSMETPAASELDQKDNWVVNKTNSKENIEAFVFNCTKKYYSNLKDQEIKNSNMYKSIVKHISDHNFDTKGWRMFFIPKNYKSEKDIADRIKKDI